MPRTRMNCEIFGTPSELPANVLPTYSDVMKLFLWYRELLKAESNKDPSVLNISKQVIVDIKCIWRKASLPTISDQRIIQKIRDYNECFFICLGEAVWVVRPGKGCAPKKNPPFDGTARLFGRSGRRYNTTNTPHRNRTRTNTTHKTRS